MEDDSNSGYEKLVVWQRAIEWACNIINTAQRYSKTERNALAD